MKASVDKDACTGCTLCTQTCPEVFKMDADDKAVVYIDEIPQDLSNCVIEAKDGCPVEAIGIK